MRFKQSDLKYTGYSEMRLYGDSKVTGPLDATLLNRTEMYEMLYFINKYMENENLYSVSDGHKIEKMIKEYVPSNIKSQENIKNWIRTNWNQY